MAFTTEADCAEMRGHVSSVVALAPGASRKAAIAWASSVLKLPIARVKGLFYGEARRIEACEADQIRAYVQQAETLIKARQDYEQRLRDFHTSAHPLVSWMAPPSLPPVEVSEEIAAEIVERASDRGAA